MAQPPAQDLMHYDALIQDALRGVVKAALKRAAAPDGLPGDHHFYITFKTQAPGVSGPADVLAKYPQEMTIVLQHQFRDAMIADGLFSVVLSFGGVPSTLVVPLAAITGFADPAVQFVLRFQSPLDIANPEEGEEPAEGAVPAEPETSGTDAEPSEAPQVVSLDAFRRRTPPKT